MRANVLIIATRIAIASAASAAIALAAPAMALAAPPPSGSVFVASYDPSTLEGITEFPGDGSAETQTALPESLQIIGGMAMDHAGDVFVAGQNPVGVGELSPSGTYTPLDSTGLAQPTGIAVDAAGDLFVLDAGSNSTPNSGKVVEYLAGGGGQKTLASGLNGPSGLALDTAGDLFIADTGNFQVLEIPAATNGGDTVQTLVSGLPNAPDSLATDGAGNLYVLINGNSEIMWVPAGTHTAKFFASLSDYADGLAVDDAGDVLTTIRPATAVTEFSPSGVLLGTIDSGLNTPQQLAVYTTAPSFTADNAPQAPNGIPYSYTFTAIGAVSFSVASGTLPPGLTLDGSTGALSGTPTTNGNYTFTVEATNDWGSTLGSGQTITVANAASTTFGYTGGEQTFVVPAEDTELTVSAVGAPGGGIPGISGGFGAQLTTDLAVTPGETLYLEVGGPGVEPTNRSGTAAGGFNGGGAGGSGDPSYGGAGGGGGGASDIRTAPRAANDLASRLVVAGGGGGDANDCQPAPGGSGSYGGFGGDAGPNNEQGYADSAGDNGPNCGAGDSGYGGAGGVTSTFSYTGNNTSYTVDAGGGAGGGTNNSTCTGSGSAGALGTGGAGQTASANEQSGEEAGGGGGGGGYYGGGGGGQGCLYSAGGGGAGSSYSAGTNTSVQTQVINGSEDSTPSITIGYGPTEQAISFTSTPSNPSAGHSYSVTATGGGSGNAVTFSIDSSSTAGACSVSSSQVSFTGAGTCVIDANQAAGGVYAAAPQAQQTIAVAASASSAVEIDQLRLSGPGGAGDQFVELYNSSSSAVPVGNWQLQGSNDASTTLGASVSIPANGHLLFTGSGYTLGSIPASDASLPAGIPAHGGVQLLAGSTVIDAVGFAGAPAGYFTGTGLPVPATLPTDNYAWVRRFTDGAPVNTSNNASDFAFVAVGAGDASTSGSELGAPGPSDLASPVVHNDILQSSLLDPDAIETASPNQIYIAGSSGAPGTLIINRVLTNCSGQTPTPNTPCANNPAGTTAMTVTRLRFRITGLTTLGSPGAGSRQAVLEAETSSGESALPLSGGGTASPLGLPLDAPSVAGMGGLYATWTATGDLPGAPSAPALVAGASIDVEFEFSVPQPGSFSFAYNSEDDLVPEHAQAGGTSTTSGSPTGTTPGSGSGGGSTTGTSPGSGGGSTTTTPPDGSPVSTGLTGTLGASSKPVPATCRAEVRSLRVMPASVRRGHRVRVQLTLTRACIAPSEVRISSAAFAGDRRRTRTVRFKIRGHESTVTVVIPTTQTPGRYTITAQAVGSRDASTRLSVTR